MTQPPVPRTGACLAPNCRTGCKAFAGRGVVAGWTTCLCGHSQQGHKLAPALNGQQQAHKVAVA